MPDAHRAHPDIDVGEPDGDEAGPREPHMATIQAARAVVRHLARRLFRQAVGKMQDGGKEKFNPKEDFINDFEWYMNRHRESFTKEQFARRMEYGQEVLSNYYDTYINRFSKIVSIELNIRNVVLNNVPLKGKLDKLEFDGKSVNVVDYKSGDPDKAIPKTKGAVRQRSPRRRLLATGGIL